jgi:hypothetical protein
MDVNKFGVGAASPEVAKEALAWWKGAAIAAGVDLAGYVADAPLAQRLAWALSVDLAVGVVDTRFSTIHQDSTADQARTCIEFAAGNGIYVPPEFICVDEAITGRQSKRPGLDRARHILEQKLATVFLVFSLSRLGRTAHETVRFFQEVLVDKGLRGISVTQSIDTAKKKVGVS